jgi:hypothetical protein
VVEGLPGKPEIQSSNPNTAKEPAEAHFLKMMVFE